MAHNILAAVLVFHTFVDNTNSRYVMDDDNYLGLLLPFPIDTCFTAKIDIPAEQHTRYQCSSDGAQVFKKVWNTSSVDDCLANNDGRVIETFNSSAVSCGRGYFDCAGNNSYVTHDLWLKKLTDSSAEICDAASLLTFPTALGCFCTNTASIKISCSNAYDGQFTHYNDTSCTTPTDTQYIENCTAIFTIEFGPSTRNVVSQIDRCTINDTNITKTPSPTAQTSSPTTYAPTENTPSPITFGSRFIMDNDWLLGENYPFPIDKCLQTQPVITQLGVNREFVYYQCNDALDQVTKYKWTKNTAVLGDGFNCSNKSTATTTIITTATHNNDICNANYFNCHGNNDYVSTFFQASEGNDCSSGIDLFTTSFVTDACFCADELSPTSRKLQCDASVSTIHEFEGTSSCVNTTDPDPIVTETGKNNECVFLQSSDISTATFNIFGTMKECVKDNMDVFTLAPSSSPTVSTLSPSAAPTQPSTSPTPQPTSSPLLPGQTMAPTQSPTTPFPTAAPTTREPTGSPTDETQAPVQAPTGLTYPPSFGPTDNPTDAPTEEEKFATTDADDGGRQNVDDRKKKTEQIIIIVILVVVAVCCCVAIIILWLMKSKEKKTAEDKKENTSKQHTAVKSKDLDGSDSSEEESNGKSKNREKQEIDIEKDETTGLKTKTGRKKKRKPKKRRSRKKKEYTSTDDEDDDDDDDVLDDAEKEKVELVTAGGPKERDDKDSTFSDL